MTVTERGFQMSLGVTQDEGIPSEVLPNDRLAAVINARVRKPGALSKRYGYTAFPRTKLEDGSNITVGKRIIRRDDELCFTDGEFLYSYAAGLNQWVKRDRIPECQVTSRREQVGDIQAGSIFVSNVARLNEYTCVMYQRLEPTSAVHTWVRVFRGDTLIDEARLSTTAIVADVITCGGLFVVVADDGTNDIVAWTWDTLDLTAPAWAGPTGLRNNSDSSGFFAVAEISALGQFALVYRRTGGNQLDVYTYDSALVQQNQALDQRAGKVFVSPGARVIGTTLVIGFINTTDGNVEAMGLVASTLAAAFAAQVIGNTVEVSGPVIVGERTSLSAWILYGNRGTATPPLTNQTGIRYRGIGVPSGTVDATTYDTYNCRHCSHIWNYGDQSYIAVKVCHTVTPDLAQDAVVVVSLGTDEVLEGDTDYRARPVARWGEGEFFSFPQGFPTRVVAGASGGTFVGAFGLVDRDFNKLAAQRGASVDVVTMSFDDIAGTRWAGQCQIGGDTLIPGGLLHCYDGELCFEAGFTYYPVIVDTEIFTAVLPATGLANGTYDYVACFVKLDKQGRLWRSRPSLVATSGVSGDPENSIRLKITHYSITSMHDSANGFAHPVGIEVYRRQGSGPFVRLAKDLDKTRVADASDPTSATYFVFEDDGTWTTANQPELYTTGGVLENNTPPPCRFSVVFNNRVFLGACDDDEVVPYSREVIHGEGAFFNIDQRFRIDDGQGIQALAVQDSSLLVFKDDNDGVFFVQGTGPNDQGLENGYTEPQKIANAHGCIEPRSVLTTNAGTFFQSRRGIERIGRGEGVGLFGEPVEDTLEAYGDIISSCVYEPAAGEIRWSAYSGLNSQLLVFTDPTQTWARDVLFGGNGRAVIDAAMVAGRYHWLGTDGYVYQESSTHYDVNTAAGLNVGVAALFRTGDIALAGGPLGKCSHFRIALLGKFGTAAEFTVSIWLDQGQTTAAQKTFSAAEVAAFKWVPIVLPEINTTTQQGRSIRVQVVDNPSGEIGAGPVWMHLLIEYGTEPGYQRLPVPVSNRK